jgi:hypothetical protein
MHGRCAAFKVQLQLPGRVCPPQIAERPHMLAPLLLSCACLGSLVP